MLWQLDFIIFNTLNKGHLPPAESDTEGWELTLGDAIANCANDNYQNVIVYSS